MAMAMSKEEREPPTRCAAYGRSTAAEIHLRVDAGEPISGTLASGAHTAGFCGWMELIAAITAARDEPHEPRAET
jgi:hypothetical protein